MFDVLIVGAGPAGCAAGIELSRAGFKVCVVEAARFPRDKVCGDAISNQGMREIDELGAGDMVRAAPHALVSCGSAVFPNGTRISRSYEPPGLIVPRVHLDDCLRRSLEAHGASLVQDTRVDALVFQQGRFCGVRTESGPLFASLILACDGYASVALRALGAGSPRGASLGISITAYYRDVLFPEGRDAADHYFDADLPHGYGWIFPAVDGISSVGVYIRSDAYARTGRRLSGLLDDFVARRQDRLAQATQVGKRRSWSLPLATHDLPLTAPGLILAGDAAGLVDPLSGEGIWQALYSGRLAARICARALRTEGLSSELAEEYRAACKREIQRPSRNKARVQTAINVLLKLKLYRWGVVQSALRWGYAHQALEMAKI